MDEKRNFKVNEHTKILVSANSYNLLEDNRLLIPFTSGEHIGFVNREGKVVVEPKYNMYYGECYNENDYIRVTTIMTYGFQRANDKVATYHRPLYGLIDCRGKVVLETNYFHIVPAIGNHNLFTVQDRNYGYSVITAEGKEIVPPGRYEWIDGFDRGFARVKSFVKYSNGIAENGNVWGVINKYGEEVIPCVYTNIWNFYGKSHNSICVVEDNILKQIPFTSLEEQIVPNIEEQNDVYETNIYDEPPTYNEYNGSYAQDIMGYSDQDINDAFDGDPDAYWNID